MTCVMLSLIHVFAPLVDCRHAEVQYSLKCRGKHVENMNKTELLDILHDDIVLEKKVSIRGYSIHVGLEQVRYILSVGNINNNMLVLTTTATTATTTYC